MKGFLASAALAAFAAFPAAAADCGDAADQATMNECYGSEYKAADQKLNADYRKIERRLAGDPDARTQLVAAQRAWIAFRDAECAFSASGVEGGSVYPTILASCLTDMTTARIKDFESYLRCEEGDLACPVPAAD